MSSPRTSSPRPSSLSISQLPAAGVRSDSPREHTHHNGDVLRNDMIVHSASPSAHTSPRNSKQASKETSPAGSEQGTPKMAHRVSAATMTTAPDGSEAPDGSGIQFTFTRATGDLKMAQDLANAQQAVAALRDQLERAKKRIAKLKKDKAAILDIADNVVARLEARTEALANADATITELKKDNVENFSIAETAVQEFDALTTQNNATKAALQAAQQEADKLRASLTNAIAQFTRLEKIAAIAIEDLNKKDVAFAEEKKQMLDAYHDEVAARLAQIAVTGGLAEVRLEDENKALKDVLSQTKAQTDEQLRIIAIQVTRLEQITAHTIEMYTKQTEHLEATQAELKAAHADVDALRNTLDKANTHIDNLQQTVNQQAREIQTLGTVIVQLRKEVEEYTRKLHDANSAIKALETKIEGYTRQLQDANNTIKTLETKIAALEKKEADALAAIANDNDRYHASLQMLATNVRALQAAVKTPDEVVGPVIATLANLTGLFSVQMQDQRKTDFPLAGNTSRPLMTAIQQTNDLLKAVHDMVEGKKTEAEMQAEVQKYRDLIEQLPTVGRWAKAKAVMAELAVLILGAIPRLLGMSKAFGIELGFGKTYHNVAYGKAYDDKKALRDCRNQAANGVLSYVGRLFPKPPTLVAADGAKPAVITTPAKTS